MINRRYARRGLGLVDAVLLLSLGLALAAGSPVAPADQPTAAPLSPDPGPAVPQASTGCWVTGDLVGEADPVVVAQALCGR